MKQKLVLMIIGIILAGSLLAQEPVSSKVIHGPAFDELMVSGPVTVELIESENASVEATGDYDFINSLSVTWQKKKLYINYFRHEQDNDPVVKVYVKNLKSIIVEEGAKISTPHPLRSYQLMLNVLDDSKARVATLGKIRIVNPENVNVERPRGKE